MGTDFGSFEPVWVEDDDDVNGQSRLVIFEMFIVVNVMEYTILR